MRVGVRVSMGDSRRDGILGERCGGGEGAVTAGDSEIRVEDRNRGENTRGMFLIIPTLWC